MKFTTKQLCITAVMTAFVFIMTFVPKIPIPLGYAHLGDGTIFIIACLVGRKEGLFAAAIGSALADFIGGFPLWIVPTLFIKLIMAYLFLQLGGDSESAAKRLFAMTVATIWMAVAYTLSGAALYDSLEAGLASAPGLLLKGAVNIGFAMFAVSALGRFNLSKLGQAY